MNTRATLFILALTAATSIASADPGELVVESLHHIYTRVAEVRIVLRNTAQVPVNLDSFQPDVLLVEHLDLDGVTWVRGSGWRCANAGAGTPRSVSPGATVEFPLLRSAAFQPGKDPDYFAAEGGAKMQLHGWYRVSVRYSLEPWSDISHIPKVIKTAESAAFEVK